MSISAAVINAGLGDLSLGLELAGIKVAAAFEADPKAIAIHSRNINAPIYPLQPEEHILKMIPNIDLVVARIYLPARLRTMRKTDEQCKNYDLTIRFLQEALAYREPQAFLLLLNRFSAWKEWFAWFASEIAGDKYRVECRIIDVAQTAGVPVKETMLCLIGTQRELEINVHFPDKKLPKPGALEEYLQFGKVVDPWYYRINSLDKLRLEDERRFYCWKNNAYVGADYAQWNYMRIPLVRDYDGIRKITHREIARLKGFPDEFELPDFNRQWLYTKLMYSGNVLVIQRIARQIYSALPNRSWNNQNLYRIKRLTELFARYLSGLAEKGILEIDKTGQPVQEADFAVRLNDRKLFFEVKYYNERTTSMSKARLACERMVSLKEFGVPILVFMNEVPSTFKAEVTQQYGIYIWDVGNLLWLFQEFPEIKNEFVALLNYTVNGIELVPPEPNVFQEQHEPETSQKEEPTLREKLLQIQPGKEHSQDYESACTEILKYALGDYLTLWETQETSNAGLYRFDLCCKIKSGVNLDFFDTIKHYFNTKYIVFEFKNYKNKIGQEEIYTTEKYLYEKALRKVAIIVSRLGADEQAMKAVRGSLRENGKLILCLSNSDLLDMIDIKEQGEREPADYLATMLDDLLVHLEK